MSKIGNKIKQIRIKKGLSQEELATSANISLRTIQRIENNETSAKPKTLHLIFSALDVEIYEKEMIFANKYFVWSSFLTLLIIVCTFTEWFQRFEIYIDGKKIFSTSSGWEGSINFFDFNFPNWIVGISTILVGFIVIGHSLGLLKNKMEYIVIPIIILSLYTLGLFQWSFIQDFQLKPGFLLIISSTVLLVMSYLENKKKNWY